MGAENFVKPPVEGKRSTRRARVLLAAKLRTPMGEIDARLRDLSRKGALLECCKVPPVGTELVFVRGTSSIPARVAWAGTDRVGLEFDKMIDEQEVLIQMKRSNSVPRPQAMPVEKYRRPGLAMQMTDEERRLVEAWGVAVGLNIEDGS